jgi:uncharacterized membrane protein YeaQ/YmgE (transglycosylase-associated protein family)
MEIANSQIVEFIVVTILLGWAIGAVAQLLVKGKVNYTFWKTSFIGVGGSIISYCLINVFDIRVYNIVGMIFISLIGTVLFLVIGERYQSTNKSVGGGGSSSGSNSDTAVNG